MYLTKLDDFICCGGTASENRKITVKNHQTGKCIWVGTAKEFKTECQKLDGCLDEWFVVEILIDKDDNSAPIDYNKGKIITVI